MPSFLNLAPGWLFCVFFKFQRKKEGVLCAPRCLGFVGGLWPHCLFGFFWRQIENVPVSFEKVCWVEREREREVALYEREPSESARRTNSENKGKEPKRNGKQTDNKKWARVRRWPGPCRQAQGATGAPAAARAPVVSEDSAQTNVACLWRPKGIGPRLAPAHMHGTIFTRKKKSPQCFLLERKLY